MSYRPEAHLFRLVILHSRVLVCQPLPQVALHSLHADHVTCFPTGFTFTFFSFFLSGAVENVKLFIYILLIFLKETLLEDFEICQCKFKETCQAIESRKPVNILRLLTDTPTMFPAPLDVQHASRTFIQMSAITDLASDSPSFSTSDAARAPGCPLPLWV